MGKVKVAFRVVLVMVILLLAYYLKDQLPLGDNPFGHWFLGPAAEKLVQDPRAFEPVAQAKTLDSGIDSKAAQASKLSEADATVDNPEVAALVKSLAPRIKIAGKQPTPGIKIFCGYKVDGFPQAYSGFAVSWFRQGEGTADEELQSAKDGSYVLTPSDTSRYLYCKVSAATPAGQKVQATAEAMLVMEGESQGS